MSDNYRELDGIEVDGTPVKFNAANVLTNVGGVFVVDNTLSIPGAAADAKKTGDKIGELKEDLNVSSVINHELAVAITSDMLELGRIDDSGSPVAHSSRCRTKYFLPVSKGDTIVIVGDPSFQSYGVKVTYYDSTKTFISESGWLYFGSNIASYPVVNTDGYIKLTYNSNDMNSFNKRVRISRTAKHYEILKSLETILNKTILPLPLELLVFGYWAANKTFNVSSSRASFRYPIPVGKDDEVHLTAKSDVLVDIAFSAEGSSTIVGRGYSNKPFKCPAKGYIYPIFKNADNSAITDLTPFGNLLTIYRNNEIGGIETTEAHNLYNGYINTSNTISDHSTRLVNWNPIHANKGDIVRINSLELMYQPYEYGTDGTLLTKAPTYITPIYVGGNLPTCGDYVVQNDDCWIMVVIAPTNGFVPSSFLPSDYPNAFSVIHIQDRNVNTADDTVVRFPKSAKKPIPFNTDAIVSQGATIVNGKLWSAVEVSGGTDYIQVIDLDSGVIEKTITHNLGHCNSLDYCAQTDTLMIVDSTDYRTILLYPNASGADTSIAKADCISVPVSADDIDFFGTCCFGQDHREVFMYCGVGSNTRYNLYKGVLGFESDEYDGSIEIIKQYDGVIRDNIDTYVTKGTTGYAQDSCYDGYFYLAYGTSGHNFLVIDLDDIHDTYKVVGNYLHHEYKDDRTEYGVEPEGVCLHNGKIYCLSRQNTIHASYFNVFDR